MNNKIHIHLNDAVKFKLNEYGKDIYRHRFDKVNVDILNRGGKPIEPIMLKVDSEGYSKMQFWEFLKIFGPYTDWTRPEYLKSLEILYEYE